MNRDSFLTHCQQLALGSPVVQEPDKRQDPRGGLVGTGYSEEDSFSFAGWGTPWFRKERGEVCMV
jgi:hypothetical protein